jgi:tetratricopeptide (TPR) repeat protein
MKKKLLATAMMCFVMMSAQAQVYGYDDYVRMPTMDLYDPGVMNMAIRAQAEAAARQQEMAARRQEMFRFYASRALEAQKAQRWYDVIENATQAISIEPIGLIFVTRGEAYEALGYYKEALNDYKAGKRDNCPEAATAYNALKAKMKEMKKKK